MALALILFAGAAVVLVWLFLWASQHEKLEETPRPTEITLTGVPAIGRRDAVLIADGRGRMIYANDTLKQWFNGTPLTIEMIARSIEPQDVFFDLLAHESQATLQFNRRWMQAESRRSTEKGETRTMLVLREGAAEAAAGSSFDPQIVINIIGEIDDTVNASQGVEPVMQALLTIVRKHIAADAGEITLWDEKMRILTPRGWVGDTTYVLALAEAGGFYRYGDGISGWIAQFRQPILVTDAEADDAVRPLLPNSPYRSFIGIPLILGERFIGTFELASSGIASFDSTNLAVLRSLARPLATAINNADLYATQARRVGEIAELQSVIDQQALASEPERVFAALAERVARMLDAQMSGSMVHDESRERLVPQPPFFGLPPVIVRSFFISVQPNTPTRALWAERDYWISPDVTDEPLADELGLTLLHNTAGVQNALLMPLVVGAKRVGMLVVFNKNSPAGFTDRDASILRPLAAQVAIAIENIRLAEQERIRETELSGLQEISQVFSAIGHTDQFYASINERLARMMNVDICGVLIQDETSAQLVAQPPFFGMDAQGYAIPVPAESPMGMVFANEEYWYSNNTATDRLIYSAGLADRLAMAGMRKTLLTTLAAAGQRIGVVQIANPVDGRDFGDEDARLLQIYAAQVGAMIENARLFRAVQEQVDVSESIRSIAEYAGAVNTPEDSFQPLLREICRLVGSPQAFINALDRETGNLKVFPEYVYNFDLPEALTYDAYAQGFEYTVATSRRPFFSSDVERDSRLVPEYRRFTEQLGLKTAVIVPLVVGDQSLGEMGVVNRFEPPYTEEDVRTLQAVAVHIAAALDRVRLTQTTGQNLRRRLQELDAISRVSNELAQTLDLDQTLEVIRHEAIRATEASGSSIALLLPVSEWRKSDQPMIERRLGERLSGLAPIELMAIGAPPKSVTIDDYGVADAPNPTPPSARSGIAVAFSYEENVVGVIHLWDERPQHFDILAAAFLETLASKASLSFGNNRRYLENQERSNRLARRVEQLNQIFELGQMLQASVEPSTMLEAIAFSVGQSIGYDIVIILMLDQEARVLRRVTQAGLPIEAFERSRELTIDVESLNTLFSRTQYRMSESYFLPFSKLTDWYVEGMEAFGAGIAVTRTMHPRNKKDWHDGDMLLVPLLGAGGDLIGVMSLDRPYDGLRPDRSAIEILEIFAHQAATTLENTRLYISSVRSAEQESRLNQVLGAISSTFDVQEIVQGVATGTMGMVPFNRMTVALLSVGGQDFDVIRVESQSKDSTVQPGLRVSREIHVDLTNTALRRAFESGQDHLYTRDDPESAGLDDLARWWTQGERVSLIVPLVAGGLVLGALHLGSELEDAASFTGQQAIIRRIASLTGIAVQNARLFADTRSRTERLSLLNRVSVSLAQSLDTENVMEIALQEIAMLLEITSARAYLVEREARVIRAIVEFPRGDAPPEDVFGFDERPIFDQVIHKPASLMISDTSATDLPYRPSHIKLPDGVAYALLPMIVAAQVTGIFELHTPAPGRRFDPEKMELAQIIANQAAIGVLNANLLEQTLVRTRELETLLEATQATAYTLDLDEVFQSVTRLALQALDLEDAAIMLYDNVEDALTVEMEFDRTSEKEYFASHDVLPLRGFPAKEFVLREGQIVIVRVNDLEADVHERADMERRGVRERMLVPLIVRDQVIGLLQVDMRTPLRTFTHREIRMAQALGAQGATAIENARLSTETAAQVEQSLIINDISFAMSATMDVVDIVDIVREQVVNLTEAEEIFLALFDSGTNLISFPMAVRDRRSITIPQRPLGTDEVSFVIRNRRPLSLGGISPSAEEVRKNLGITSSDPDTARFLGVPLIAGDEILGVLAIRDTHQRRPFGLNDQRILNAIATQLAATLQNARLFERVRSFAAELNTRVQERTQELQEERDRLEALYQITSELARTLDADRIYVRSLEMTVRAIDADAGFVTLVDPVNERLYTRVAMTGAAGEIIERDGSGTGLLSDANRHRSPAERFADWLLQHERSMLVEDLHGTPFWDDSIPGADEWNSAMGVALETNEEVQGVIVVFGRRAGQFNVSQLRLLLAAANQIASSVNNAELYSLIRDQNDRMTALLQAEQEEAEKNSAILEGIADGVMLADANGAIVLFNRAAEYILDIPRDYALGQTLSHLGAQYGSAYRWVNRLSQWINDPGHSSELTIDRLEIGRRVVGVRASPVFNGDQALGTVAVFRDVTRDVEVDRMKSEFISNVSHELRTPMTSIMGYAELLLGGAAGAPSDTQRRFLQTIKANADRLASLVGDLLNISRIDSGRDHVQIQTVDIGEVIDEVASSVSGRAQHVEKRIDLNIHVEPGMPLIHADRHKVTQILNNILENAYNYTHPGGKIEIEAYPRLHGDRSQVVISVQDNGIGIPEEFRDRIFNRFERYEENALVMEVAGTGLGLSIVKALVDMHEGDIWFESEVNKGSTFYIALPVEGPLQTTNGAADDETLRASLN